MKFQDLAKPPSVEPVAVIGFSQEANSFTLTEPVAASPTQEPYLKKGEYTKDETPAPPQGKGVALYGKAYAEGKGWVVCASCFESIEKRSQGQRYLSYREADIAARNKLLDNKAVVDALLSPFEFLLSEDIVGLKDSIYEMRLVWNRGIEYKKTTYLKQTGAQKKKCDDYMLSLRAKFDKIGLPLWPEELEHGFHSTLCRPEYMTDEQYRLKVSQFDTLLLEWTKQGSN